MRIFYFPNGITVLIDFIAWFFLHMLIAYGATLLPATIFRKDSWLYRTRRWEEGGAAYEKIFKVNRWKGLLPDGASWFRQGFAKKSITSLNAEYLERFILETRRGEFAHWIVICVSPLFFLFNPWYAGVIMIVYAFAANLPCIIAQRYNRPRLAAILQRKLSPRRAGRVTES